MCAAMLCYGRINNFFATDPQLAVGARLIRLHKSVVGNDVGS